jgi:small-conductance mechanosensitive channel
MDWFFYNFFREENPTWEYIVLRAVVILAITYVLAKLAKKIGANTKRFEKLHFKFLRSIIIIFIYTAGILFVLNQLPDFNFTALLAGSGIIALSIGLAAQESLGNFVNGIFLSLSKPFEVGDRIKLVNGNITGIIENITPRHTVVRTFLNSRIIIPNSVINKDMIENSNIIETRAAGNIDVTITYDSDMELAQKIISEIIADSPYASGKQGSKAAVEVFACNLGLHGVELRATLWTDDVNDNFRACSDARKAIKREFDSAGIRIASAGGARLPS